MASGGSYLQSVKESWAMAKAERNEAINEFMKISELYKDNELGPLYFQREMFKNIKSALEVSALTDPINKEIKLQNLEIAKADLASTNEKIQLIKNQRIENETNKEVKKEEEKLNLDLKRQQIASAKAQEQALIAKTNIARSEAKRKLSALKNPTQAIQAKRDEALVKSSTDPRSRVTDTTVSYTHLTLPTICSV